MAAPLTAAIAFIRRLFGPRHMFAAGPFVQVAPTAPDGTIDFSARAAEPPKDAA